MNKEVFNNISKIIERDSKSTTYKYALLRGVIDIIQDNSPYILVGENRVQIPTGLLIEKWLLYYYPILQCETSIPQINGETNLAFSHHLSKIIFAYEARGGFSAFYNDLKNKGIPEDLQNDFFELVKKLRDTITKMPMKYIGRSITNDFYSLFNYENQPLRRHSTIDIETLIKDFGAFSIPIEYYEAFKILGSFINGQDSILFKWAEFSVNASGNNLSVHKVLNEVLKSPITLREIKESKKLYKEILQKKGMFYCVWTGKRITSLNESNIDHMIPFSVWKNNDLWNLLPSDARINNQKRDKIPTPEIIDKQKYLILDYWEIIFESQSKRFQKEIQVALLGNNTFESWKKDAIPQLQNSCNYLIENRGFEGWNI
jgi:HNH endonuclease